MMTSLAFILTLLSALFMGAHFLRAGSMTIAIICLLVPFILFIRRLWALRTVQVVLVLWTLEWLRTLIAIAIARADDGRPWLRMAIILGVVAGVNVAAAAVVEVVARRRRRGSGPLPANPPATNPPSEPLPPA